MNRDQQNIAPGPDPALKSNNNAETLKQLRAQQAADKQQTGNVALPVTTAGSDSSFDMHSQKNGMNVFIL